MLERDFLLRLHLCPHMGLLSKYRVWQTAHKFHEFNNYRFLGQQAGLSTKTMDYFVDHFMDSDVDKLLVLNHGVPHVCLLDPDYPQCLRECFCPPLVLYYAGKRELLSDKKLAVVGARNMTPYGQAALRQLLPPIVAQNITIVSGLARGIDGAAHRLTLKHDGNAIAVIGNGLDRFYPRENADLQNMIVQSGLLLTEYPLGTGPLPFHFPERNRIIAGLATACLVVEARQKSGSLITANIAVQENRNVLAVPGSIMQPLSKGCNELIAEGARPALNASDILEELTMFSL